MRHPLPPSRAYPILDGRWLTSKSGSRCLGLVYVLIDSAIVSGSVMCCSLLIQVSFLKRCAYLSCIFMSEEPQEPLSFSKHICRWSTESIRYDVFWVCSNFQYCEVAAGTDIVKKSLAAFTVPTVATTIVVDGMAYDGFPALTALEDTCLCNPPKNHKSMMQNYWLERMHQPCSDLTFCISIQVS